MNDMKTSTDTSEAPDVRPLVAGTSRGPGPWLMGGGVFFASMLLLLVVLPDRRAPVEAPAIAASQGGSGLSASFPELVIPPAPSALAMVMPSGPDPAVTTQLLLRARPIGVANAPSMRSPGTGGRAQPYAIMAVRRPALAYPSLGDGRPVDPRPADAWETPAQMPSENKDRVKAARFVHPETTVPKGAVIQAVLESALDSTRGGFARALVSRDIHSFDGSRVLIQRGSRILGEYQSDISLGQKRILIRWQRLTRPDGVIVDLDSPSADALGRAGVGGKVDTHFFERFAGAILQSSLDLGVQLAARAASNGTVVLALPGTMSQGGQSGSPERIPPTVTVRQGASISVFVAKDLDFAETDR